MDLTTYDQTTYTPTSALSAGTTYYWEVHAKAGSLDQAGYWSQGNFTTAAAAATRIISLSNNLTFGNVTVGSTPQSSFTIYNTGNSTLTVSSISYPSGFSGNWSGTIAAGGSQGMTVTFSPTSAISYGGTVTVNSDATSGTNTITASGTGTASPTRIISLSGNLAFGSVTVGSSPQSTLTVNNTGNSTLTVSSISYPSGFSGNWSGTIVAGGSQGVTVTFSPTSATSYGGTVTVNSDETSGTNTITASGTGTAAATRIISLSGIMAFGSLAVGSSEGALLTIYNNGNSTMTVSGISYPSGFSGSWSGTIAAGGSQGVTVTFSPTSAISYGGTVTVNSDATSGTNTISVSGTGAAVDTTPDPFTFAAQTGVTLSTTATSNTITVSGINAAASITITGGTYSINSGVYTSAAGMVNNGDTVAVRQTSSGSYSSTTNATLTIGGVSGTFSVTTQSAPADTTPDPFTFAAQTGVALSTTATSNTITVSGINAAASITITGGTYSINSGSYTSAAGTVNNGNTVTVRQTSSGSYSSTTNATLTIGGVSGTFSVTTQSTSVDTTPPTVSLTAPNSGTFSLGSQMTISATASDASGISYCCYALVKGGTVLGIIYQDSVGGGMVNSYNWTVPATFNGYTINGTDYQIFVEAWDASSNQNHNGAVSSGYLTLQPAAIPAPSISSVSPPSMPPLNANQTLTIYGNNFQSGATLTFVPPEGGTIASTASKLTFVSSSQISYQINNLSDSGSWTVKVNNPDGQSSGTAIFTVTAGVLPPPTCKFGSFDGQNNVKLTLKDCSNNDVTFGLTGGGYGEINCDDCSFSTITLFNTTDKSTLTISTKGNVGTSVGDISCSGPLKGISATNIELDGSITIGSSSNPKASVIMVFDQANNLTINSQMPIQSISATEWFGGSIDAPSIGSITTKGDKKRSITGDLDVDVTSGTIQSIKTAGTLSGDWTCDSIKSISATDIVETNLTLNQQPDAKTLALGSLIAKGEINSSQILSQGNVGTVTAGAMIDSNCFAGVAEGITGLPAAETASFSKTATIKSIAIKGIKTESSPYYINSNIAAANILSASIVYPQSDNGGVPFGLSADNINKLTIKKTDGTTTSLKNLGKSTDSQTIDGVEIRLY